MIVSHDGARVDVVVAEHEDSVVIDGGVCLVGEVAVDALVEAVAVVVVGGGVGGLVKVLGGVRVVLAVVRVGPELGLAPRPPHHLQHLPLVDVPRHRHLLRVHVHLHTVHSYIRCIAQVERERQSYLHMRTLTIINKSYLNVFRKFKVYYLK